MPACGSSPTWQRSSPGDSRSCTRCGHERSSARSTERSAKAPMPDEAPMDVQNEVAGFGGQKNKLGLNVVSLALFTGMAALLSAIVLRLPLAPEARGAGLATALVAATLLALSARMANQWERAVVLRLGQYQGLKGPGIFWMWPFVDRVTMWLDSRVRATGFAAEKTLTADTVPVNVDAVLFWAVKDPEKAALRVQDYRE